MHSDRFHYFMNVPCWIPMDFWGYKLRLWEQRFTAGWAVCRLAGSLPLSDAVCRWAGWFINELCVWLWHITHPRHSRIWVDSIIYNKIYTQAGPYAWEDSTAAASRMKRTPYKSFHSWSHTTQKETGRRKTSCTNHSTPGLWKGFKLPSRSRRSLMKQKNPSAAAYELGADNYLTGLTLRHG